MADAASQKEWPRSKLIGATSRNKFWEPQQDITGRPVFKIKYIISRSIDRLVYTESYRSGHNGADSKSVVWFIPDQGFESLTLRQFRGTSP